MKIIKIIISAFALLVSSNIFAVNLNGFVVFGDSLSDNGNLYEFMNHQLPLSPPYYEGRFSNGPVWIEHLTEFYFPGQADKYLENYAFGGAGILPPEDEDPDSIFFTLKREINNYFVKYENADSNKLYVVWIGSNNYLALPEELDQTIDIVLHGVKEGLKTLASRGAKHIMVLNLPELGRTPAAYEFDAVEDLTYLSNTHNKRLEEELEQLKLQFPDVTWYFLNVTELMGVVFDNPQSYGFSNVTGTCYEALMDEENPLNISNFTPREFRSDACTGYLFFDPVHPSGSAHYIMAEQTRDLLETMNINFIK